jgi:hypothetical protein
MWSAVASHLGSDASGSVDAITGEGLCLAFQQAIALASALETGNLDAYQAEHRRLLRRSAFMAALMLSLNEFDGSANARCVRSPPRPLPFLLRWPRMSKHYRWLSLFLRESFR